MRILFITANRLGDAILASGLLDHLIHAYPHARITVACGPVAVGLFREMPNLDQIITIEKRPFGVHWLPLWRAAAASAWDLVLDIRKSAISWIIPVKHRAMPRTVPGPKIRELSTALRLSDPPSPVVWFSAKQIARVSAIVPSNRPLAVLAPTANWTPKVWPPERFVALFRHLAATAPPGALTAVVAGPGEAEAAMALPVTRALPDAIDLVGRLTLPEIAALLSRARLFVGNDSGLMHLAAAAGAPTLGLFGPTDASRYAPVGRRAAALVSPTGTMEGITVARAAEASIALLDAGSPLECQTVLTR